MVNMGLASLGGLLGGYFQQQNQRTADKMGRIQGQMQLSQAIRNRMMTEYDNKLAQRQAEEGAAQSGVYDPSDPMNVGAQSVKRTTDRGNMALEGAKEQENLAGQQMTAIKKAIDARRQQYYTNMGLHLLGTGIGVYNMMPSGSSNADLLSLLQKQDGWAGNGGSYNPNNVQWYNPY